VAFFVHRAKRGRLKRAHAKRDVGNHQQAAGKFSDFAPLPCGVDRYANPALPSEMSLQHPPRMNELRYLLKESRWPNMSEGALRFAIVKLATEERCTLGPARARWRRKRLAAVNLFKTRFMRVPTLTEFSMRPLERFRREAAKRENNYGPDPEF